MHRVIAAVLICVMLISLGGCNSAPAENTSQITSGQQPEMKYSENILVSVNDGAAGYGTIAECTDATIMIYTDRKVRVFMDIEDNPEAGSLELTEEDYQKLAELAQPDKINNLQVINDMEVCDGSSYFITLYDESDKKLTSKGGYMPVSDEFWEIYSGIKDILKPYGISEMVDAYRETMQAE